MNSDNSAHLLSAHVSEQGKHGLIALIFSIRITIIIVRLVPAIRSAAQELLSSEKYT